MDVFNSQHAHNYAQNSHFSHLPHGTYYSGISRAKNAARTGNRFQIDLVCNNVRFQGNGTAEGFFNSPEDFPEHTKFDSIVTCDSIFMGNPIYTTAETRGRWIGERCSVVQPEQPMQPVIVLSAVPKFFPIQ